MLKNQETTVHVDKTLAEKLSIAIVRPEYHDTLNTNLETSCKATLRENGIPESQIKTFIVPGSWELPLMVQQVAKSGEFDAIVVFGVIVKGETYHFELIANEVARALMQLSLDYSLPIALEVLAVYEMQQAEARAGKDTHNKGIEGATAVLKSLAGLQQFSK